MRLRNMCGAPLVMLALIATPATTGCGNGPRERWAAENTYLFSDRSHAELEHLYVVRDSRAFVQVAVFPGYQSRKWYRCDMVPGALSQQLRSWAVRPGDISPPFEPGGAHFGRITLVPNEAKERDKAWYRDDNREAQTWMAALRRDFVVEQYRARQLPDWVREDERIIHLLGMANDLQPSRPH